MRCFLRVFASIVVACSLLFLVTKTVVLEEEYRRLFQELEIAKIGFNASRKHGSSQQSFLDLDRLTEKSWPDLRKLQSSSRELGYVSFFDYTSAQSNSGCLIYNLSADVTVAVNDSTSCNGKRCPPCFALDTAGGNGTHVHTLIMSGCSSMHTFSNSLQKLMLINLHRTSSAFVSDGSYHYKIAAGEHVIGSCSTTSSNIMHMPSTLRIYPRAGSTWQQQTAAAPWTARNEHDLVVRLDGVILLLGGWAGIPYGTHRKNDVWSSNDGSKWQLLTANAAWSARNAFRAVVRRDGVVLVTAGHNTTFLNDVYASSDGGTTWKELTSAAAWSQRKYPGINVLLDGTVLVFGGLDWGSNKLNDVWASSDGGSTWAQKTASAAWSARQRHGSVVRLDGTVLVLGGRDAGGDKNDVYASNDGGSTWYLLTSAAAWSARETQNAVVVQLDGSVVLIGGFSSPWGGFDGERDVWRSSDGGSTWQRLTSGSSAPYYARGLHAAVVRLDGSLVFAGGSSGYVKNDVYISES